MRLASLPLAHPLKWVGSHARLAPIILAVADEALGGRTPTAIVDPTVGGGGLLIHAANRWPDAPLLLADTCEPLARLWLDLSTAAGAAEVEMVVAEHAATWDAADHNAQGEPVDALTRRTYRRVWYKETREAFNDFNLPMRGRCMDYEVTEYYAGEFAALLRGSYNGLCRFSAGGQFNAPCSAHLADRPGKPLYQPGTFAAVGVDFERRGVTVLHADYRAALIEWAPRLRGALVYIDPPFPGTFTAYSPGCVAPPIAELAEACAWASLCGATVLASHPAEGADEWRQRLPGATVRTDLTRRGAMEPTAATKPRKDKPELLLTLLPGVGTEPRALARAA